MIVSLTGDDQRRTRFVDEDRIDLVDNGVGQLSLHPILRRIDHVVAQVVEAEFVVRPIGDVAGEGRLFRVMVHLRQVDADGQAEEPVQLPHPFGVAIGQIVVHRDDMHAIAGQCIQIGRQGGDQGLSFAGAHFGNLAMMQNHAADQLHVEVPHSEGSLAGFTHHGKRLRQQRIKGRALNSSVLARSASSVSALTPASSALIWRTTAEYWRISRSLRLPKIFLRSPEIIWIVL